MRRAAKLLLNPLLTPLKTLPVITRPLSATTKTTTIEKPQVLTKPSKDSLILEKFRQRKLQGSSKATTTDPRAVTSSSNGRHESGDQRKGNEPTQEVSSFEELGLKEELIEGAGEMGFWVPNEIQCVGIPAILEHKNVVLSSEPGTSRTLAYLLPLLQLLQLDEAFSAMRPHYPKAIVLCPTEELADEGFQMAKFLSDSARSKSKRISGPGQSHQEGASDAPIGMLIGTPSEVLLQVEDGSILIDDVKYLVLDEADTMLDHSIGSQISKIASPLKRRESEPNSQGCQTVFVTSAATKILGEEFSPFMERLGHDNAGEVTAMLLEMEQAEVFDIIESPDALKKKVSEAMSSLVH